MDCKTWVCILTTVSGICVAQTERYLFDTTTEYSAEQGCREPVVQNAHLLNDAAPSYSNYSKGVFVEIECDHGYRVPFTRMTVIQMICEGGGIWRNVASSSASCERIGGCPALVIPHAIMPNRSQNYMPGDVERLLCVNDYTAAVDHELIMCQSDGTWKTYIQPHVYPVCVSLSVDTCALPDRIAHGSFRTTYLEGRTLDITDSLSGRATKGTILVYYCYTGYHMDDPLNADQQCKGSHWSGSPPACIKNSASGCSLPRRIKHASYKVYTNTGPYMSVDGTVPGGSWLKYECDKGYTMKDEPGVMPVCYEQKWQGAFPQCNFVGGCEPPKDIENGAYYVSKGSLDSSEVSTDVGTGYTEGVKVYYYCNNGYKNMKKRDANMSDLECRDSNWMGTVPVCERRTHCDAPMDIPNGNWVADIYRLNYGIGTRISYECRDGFKALGATMLECLSSGYWSDHAPRCLAESQYCGEPGTLENGIYMCHPEHCDMFGVGTKVHYICNTDYEPRPQDDMVQKCMPGGAWSSKKPVCNLVADNQSSTSMGSFSTSTLTVVIATSCGVLGLLVLVMVVVALQRRRKHHPRNNRLCHSSPPPPPPYQSTPPTGLVDDPDRVALIAFADGVQVVLPSYEEAVRSRGGSRLSRYTSDSTRGSIRSSSSRDYRPLPSLPPNLRGGVGGPQIREIPADSHRDHHRNSIITTTSITTRDNLSLALGSMDTMNISDGTSTTVTVDTASSNPSIATSQRATAGSIESSSTHGSLATEDAPLLDQNHYNTETIRSHHSNSSDTHHGGVGRCQCNERIAGYDTLHGQTSRSQSESSPIVEIPEEQKET